MDTNLNNNNNNNNNNNLFIVNVYYYYYYYYFLAFVIISFSSPNFAADSSSGLIGMNYGRMGDDLPRPAEVVKLLQSQGINRVKIFDTDITLLKAFSGSGIKLVVGLTKELLPYVSQDQYSANQWVEQNIVPYYPSTLIQAIAIGNEIFQDYPNGQTKYLVSAMRNLHTALTKHNLQLAIKISSPIAFAAFQNSSPPSAGRFRTELIEPVIEPMLDFLRQTDSYLMLNAYPYYDAAANATTSLSLDYVLFRQNPGVVDSGNGLRYFSFFEAEIDVAYAAMSALKYNDLKVVVTGTGWPYKGDEFGACSHALPHCAAAYNGNLVKRILTGGGTPLRPNQPLDVYFFSLFNENMKTDPIARRYFGFFDSNGTNTYNISFKSSSEGGGPSSNKTVIDGGPSSNKTVIAAAGLHWGSKIMIGVFAGVGIVGGLFLLIFLRLIYRKNQMKSRERITSTGNHNVEQFLETYGCLSLQTYKYKDIKKMTNSFKDKLGEGGYGSVFKGKLVDGRLVAVKVLRNDPKRDNGEEFMNEVATIGRTNHINVVSLLGYCASAPQRALVYEFMPNGSLEKFIYAKKEKCTTATTVNGIHRLGWEKLFQIALGIARGLEYLHRGCSSGRILHFDIKPHNILLDEHFCPKISDFGLAKLCPTRESIVSMHGEGRGTLGYIAPEFYCRNFGGVSYKSDVYSYGMMVLEMVGGRKNMDPFVENTSEICFSHWIYDHLEDQNDEIEHLLRFEGESEEEIMARKMIIAGLWCVQTNPSCRPSMSKVSEMLEGKLEDLKMPPKPIVESFPPRA